jgi:hypothetical protein
MAGWYELPGTLKGADGVSVTTASVDGNGGLSLTLSNGTTLGPFPVRGPQGIQGETGTAGTAGRGVASASYDAEAGTLTLTFTDSTTAGPFPVKGEEGKSIEFTGTVATYAALPTNLGPDDAGEGYYVEADGELYPWSGAAFPAQGSGIEVRGPQGIQGVQGVRGTRATVGTTPPATGVMLGDWNLNPATGKIAVYADNPPT